MSVTNVGKRILIIDDEPQILYLMKVFLQDEGFEVSVCNNSTKVVSIIENEKIDAVVCDFLMPQKNGLECIQAIRQEFGREIPVVIATAVHHLDIEKVKEVGGNDLVRKPIDFTKLSAILDRELNQKKLLKPEDFESLDVKAYLVEGAGQKVAIRLTQLAESQLYFELPKDKVTLGAIKFFELFLEVENDKIHFPFKGEVVNLVAIDAQVDMIVVDLKIYDNACFEKVRRIYSERQQMISDFIKNAKGL